MASDNHTYNRTETRDTFNSEAQPSFTEVTPDAKLEALRNVEKLIEQTRRELEGQ